MQSEKSLVSIHTTNSNIQDIIPVTYSLQIVLPYLIENDIIQMNRENFFKCLCNHQQLDLTIINITLII